MSALSAHQQIKTDYPQIDADPHFKRVVRYMRPSDYAVWGAGAAAFPAALYGLESLDPTGASKQVMRASGRLGLFLGTCGGFLLAYQNSSSRLWGVSENAREVAMAKEDIDPNTLESSLDPYMQGVAYRNSVWSQMKFSVLPWFNLVNHKHHGPGVQSQSGDEQ